MCEQWYLFRRKMCVAISSSRNIETRLNFKSVVFFFQAEDGIRDLVRSRGLGDVYKRQPHANPQHLDHAKGERAMKPRVLAILAGATVGVLLLSLIHI